MKNQTIDDIEVEVGSGNVFADLYIHIIATQAIHDNM
jgi:hypothetical protein